MCVPCAKELINNGFRQASESADLIAALAQQPVRTITQQQDDLLYGLACDEVDGILDVRGRQVELVTMQGSPKRWVELLERLR